MDAPYSVGLTITFNNFCSHLIAAKLVLKQQNGINNMTGYRINLSNDLIQNINYFLY